MSATSLAASPASPSLKGSTGYAYDAQGRVIQARQILSPNANANPQVVVQYTAYTHDAKGTIVSGGT
ncbi:MAG: hypothetical protein IPJ18_21885 [Betaproteobacteria bacterium]|nr:hypothetical protein [Betaproteobacteria bacterium]